MRRHWQLLCCTFSFCWYHASHPASSSVPEPQECTQASGVEVSDVPDREADTGEKAVTRTTFDPRCPGPGSCCADVGVGGPSSHLLRCCNSCSLGLSRA